MDEDKAELGRRIRREVLGEEHAGRIAAATDDLVRPFLDFVARYAWGDVWARPELDRRTRSMITLAMLTALGRPNELELHIGGALRNGVGREEIIEIFLHAAIYCGAPAAAEAVRAARRVFDAADA